MLGNAAGVWVLWAALLCVCAVAVAVAFYAHRSLRRLEAEEDRAFDRLLSDVEQTTRAIARTRSLVRRRFGVTTGR